MTSPRQRRDRPIEHVELTIAFRSDRKTVAKIREVVPTAILRGGVCKVRLEADQPDEVAEKARVLLERIRNVA